MSFIGIKNASWILATLLPLVFIVFVYGGPQKEVETTPSPQSVTRDNNGNLTDYGIYYYEYPEGLFMNETYNNTYGMGFFDYNDYYDDDYYGYYVYPEFLAYYDPMEDNSTQNSVPTVMTTKKPEKETRKPRSERSRRKTRTLPEDREISHLCLMNQLNVINLFDKRTPYIFECKDKKFKHFACYNSDGFIKPCYGMKDEKKPLVPLCIIKKGNTSYVTTCNSSEPQSFCFTTPRETNKIAICEDEKFRVCLKRNLTICNNQEKKRVSQIITSLSKDQHQPDTNKRERRAIVSLPKDHNRPDVNKRVRRAILSPPRIKTRQVKNPTTVSSREGKNRPDVQKRLRRAIVNLRKVQNQPDVNERREILSPINTKQVKKRAIVSPPESKKQPDVKKRASRGIVTPSKDKTRPDVNCKNCKVDVKMIVDEMTDDPPRILINVSQMDSPEKIDMEDNDFDK